MSLDDLKGNLALAIIEHDLQVDMQMVEGVTPTLELKIEGREEFPIYITMDAEQILVTTYLWKEDEILQERRTELLEALLILNLPMPLSSFSKIGNQYVIFGALSSNTEPDDVLHEAVVLSDNTIESLDSVTEYLQSK